VVIKSAPEGERTEGERGLRERGKEGERGLRERGREGAEGKREREG
jgi:hypothetical protein